jgi:hypothetical protein
VTHTGLAREGIVRPCVGPKPALGVSRQSIKGKCWFGNQHMAFWYDLASTRRQAGELISGPGPAGKPRLPHFNRMKYTVVGILTGQNTPRRHLYTVRLNDSPVCKGCGSEFETSAHDLYECEALATLRHTYLGSFLVDTEGVRIQV